MKRTQNKPSTIKRLLTLVMVALLLGMVSSAVACGDDKITTNGDDNDNQEDENGDENGSDIPGFDERTTEIHESRCSIMLDCCDASQLEEEFGADFGDPDECQDERAFGSGVPGLEAFDFDDAYDAGRIEFDESEAELCAESLSDLSCSDFDGSDRQRESLPGCGDMIIGQQGVGDECNANFECSSGACDGTECYNPTSVGGDCNSDFECGDDAFCEAFDNECQELRSVGDECGQDRECETGLCDDDGSGRVCQERPAVCE